MYGVIQTLHVTGVILPGGSEVRGSRVSTVDRQDADFSCDLSEWGTSLSGLMQGEPLQEQPRRSLFLASWGTA
ncbi:MAG: hypothetical protein GX162_03830 [Firmicutes bacterium]|jgi:hypothetical protein|nr:hypothetical protein [Bacillota bacterium]